MLKRLILVPIVFAILILFSCDSRQSEEDGKAAVAAKTSTHHHHVADHKTRQYLDEINSGQVLHDTLEGSPLMLERMTIGKSKVRITYSSPGVKGREIWGKLVHYDRVWVSGAHQATTIKFTHTVELNGKVIPAGKYALFTIPGKVKWTVIINKNYNQHLADDYSADEDVARFELVAQRMDKSVPRLRYRVIPRSMTDGEINLEWERIRVSIPVHVPN